MRARRVTDRRPRWRGARLLAGCLNGIPATYPALLRRARRRPQTARATPPWIRDPCDYAGPDRVAFALVAGELLIWWGGRAATPTIPPDFVRTALRQHPEDLVIAT